MSTTILDYDKSVKKSSMAFFYGVVLCIIKQYNGQYGQMEGANDGDGTAGCGGGI